MHLHNDYLIIEAEERGAQLMRIYSPEFDYEYLWINDPDVWGWRAPNLFPIIGELKDGKYQYEGEWYEMGRHGFVRDASFSGEHTANTMRFVKSFDEETLKQYPFKFELEIEYILSGRSLYVWYMVRNLDDKSMPFSVGGHPAFTAFPLEDHYLTFEVNETVYSDSLNKYGLRTGFHRSGIENGRIQLSLESFDSDALILKNFKSSYLELRSNNSPRLVRFHFGQFPYLGIWSKPGAPYVCIEPWYGVADSQDSTGNILVKEGISLLPPESKFRIGCRMDFY